nr:hypothetical protein [Tanacetum cinerariifolium]
MDYEVAPQSGIPLRCDFGGVIRGHFGRSAELQEIKTKRTRKAQERGVIKKRKGLMAFSSSNSGLEIVDNCKKGLGYENYNAVSPPYIGKFMPTIPDLSFTGLDEFVNNPAVENYISMSSEEELKVVRKHDDALVIKEWVSDNKEKDVSQLKI